MQVRILHDPFNKQEWVSNGLFSLVPASGFCRACEAGFISQSFWEVRLNTMTMPHLENCGHSDLGWCLDCVRKLNDDWESRFTEASMNCRYQHNDAECKAVGELLEYLNNWPKSTGIGDLGLEGKLDVYFIDCVMGTIEDDGDGGFNYFPLAFGQKGKHENQGKDV